MIPAEAKKELTTPRGIKKHRCPCCGSLDYCSMESFGWNCEKPELTDVDCLKGCYDARLAGVVCEHKGKE